MESSNVIRVLEQVRKDVTVTNLIQVEMDKPFNIAPSIQCHCSRQHNWENMSAEASETYYSHTCTLAILFLDQLISEMDSRFSDTQKTVLGLSLLPTAMDKDWKRLWSWTDTESLCSKESAGLVEYLNIYVCNQPNRIILYATCGRKNSRHTSPLAVCKQPDHPVENSRYW